MPSSRQVGRISSSIPRERSEYSICRSEIGCTAVRTADRLGPDLGQSDVADVASVHHLADRADRLLDREVGEDPPGPIDVDVVGAQPAERVGEEVLRRLRAAGRCRRSHPSGARMSPNLTLSTACSRFAASERVANEQLVVPRRVVVARVEQGDAGVERGLDRGDRLRLVRGAVEVGHAHAAESERRDVEAGGAERSCGHRESSPRFAV